MLTGVRRSLNLRVGFLCRSCNSIQERFRRKIVDIATRALANPSNPDRPSVLRPLTYFKCRNRKDLCSTPALRGRTFSLALPMRRQRRELL